MRKWIYLAPLVALGLAWPCTYGGRPWKANVTPRMTTAECRQQTIELGHVPATLMDLGSMLGRVPAEELDRKRMSVYWHDRLLIPTALCNGKIDLTNAKECLDACQKGRSLKALPP